MAGVGVKVENITKRFGKVVAVDNLSLEIKPGELFTLLGPSGCGKTTLLRTIAGFYFQEAGSIRIDEKIVDHIPPHKRDTGMVFQSYAIFPFMSVFDNVAYGLKARKISRDEIRKRVTRAIELVRLTGLEKRRPDQLSGGQLQRVAVARAVVIEPRVLLMDEPLSNLDAKLRVEMRVDIRRLQKKLGITMIYVTHDQEEALAISDRIAVMSTGKVAQVGSAWDIYNKPATSHVAGFIGVTNFFACQVVKQGAESVLVDFQGQNVEFPCVLKEKTEEVVVSVRPESLEIIGKGDQPAEGNIRFSAKVFDTIYLGADLRITLESGSGDRFQVEVNNPSPEDQLEEGREVELCFSPAEVSVFSGKEFDETV